METGSCWPIWGGRASSGPIAGEGSRSCSGRRYQGTLAGRFVRREWERPSTGWWMRQRGVGRLPALRSGGKRQGAQPGQGATELGLPRPVLGQWQAAGRAGEPSGEGEEAPPQGFGGQHLLAQTDARRPAGQVVSHRLHRQPSALRQAQDWRGKRPDGRWFRPTPYLRSRMAFSISAWRRWSASSSRVSPSRSVMKA